MKISQIPDGKLARSIFAVAALFLLLILLHGAKDAGISGDEEVHYNQSVKVYNYFASFGKDQSALDTPTTHLKYYGQSFDNLTTILIRWFSIDDIYTFRHIMNSLAAWVAILIAALLAIWLSGYGAGIITLLLFAVSPTFLGHAQNNLKDIPFALAYIAGTFFLLRWLFSERQKWQDLLPLILSFAFGISIRPGGLLLICYLLLFVMVLEAAHYHETSKISLGRLRPKLISIILIILLSWLFGILPWPYALQNPVSGLWESFKVMSQFPTTIRQVFEGSHEWSDFMPWYYLPKLMLITIPLLVWVGIICFFALTRKAPKKDFLKYAMLILTILFPIAFVIYEKSNLYGSWRHFLFIYPGMVVLASIGLWQLILRFKARLVQLVVILFLLVLAFHPVSFLVRNHPYYYLYYNQLTGGLKGAYGNYETDYYYHSMRQGSEWLIGYLKQNHPGDTLKIGTNFPADWFFRKEKNLTAKYFPYNERSQQDWDYYIVANSYIPPVLLNNKVWPPKNSIKIIEAEGVPICAVLKRENKADLLGYQAYNKGQNEEAIKYFEEVVKKDCQDELIFFNFASVCYEMGDPEKALILLKKGLEINPENDRILMFQANIYAEKGDFTRAAELYQTVIRVNRKYFDAYPALARILVSQEEVKKARELLKTCLTMSPSFKEAIIGLADSYRSTDPEVARKYDELAKTIK
ncbi:MAG TPA: tetratricopeptide repeat protein [Prolixibacteraceae bacterium]